MDIDPSHLEDDYIELAIHSKYYFKIKISFEFN